MSQQSLYMVHHSRKPTVTKKLVCENIVTFTLSVVNDLLFYFDELKIVWYVLLSYVRKAVDMGIQNFHYK